MNPDPSMILRLPFLSAVSIALVGCTAGQDAPSTSIPPRVSEASCEGESLEQFVGQIASAELGARMLKLSGAQRLRWVPPRTAVTMDFRPDRLTVHYDDDARIIRANCG